MASLSSTGSRRRSQWLIIAAIAVLLHLLLFIGVKAGLLRGIPAHSRRQRGVDEPPLLAALRPSSWFPSRWRARNRRWHSRNPKRRRPRPILRPEENPRRRGRRRGEHPRRDRGVAGPDPVRAGHARRHRPPPAGRDHVAGDREAGALSGPPRRHPHPRRSFRRGAAGRTRSPPTTPPTAPRPRSMPPAAFASGPAPSTARARAMWTQIRIEFRRQRR